MKLSEIYKNYLPQIVVYPEQEAKEILFLVLENKFGITKNELILDQRDLYLEKINFEEILKRINSNEPIQYILEHAWFRNRKFFVDKDVLIPRPETEELIDLAKKTNSKKILDLGTGSGCIAISLALESPISNVFALDISENVLIIAKKNAKKLNARVNFEKADILDFKNPFQEKQFDLIVSNPPYVKMNEKNEMKANVLNFEPHIALFVEDNNPLIFYEKLAQIGQKLLVEAGWIIVEINSYLANETALLFNEKNFVNVQIIKDFFDRDRFVIGQKISD